MSSRIETLRSMLAQDAANAFARYGLAMEFVRTGELASAMPEFESLLSQSPDYCAGYFHGGQTLEKLGKTEEAAAMYRRGIEATERTGDAHTRSELQAALDLL